MSPLPSAPVTSPDAWPVRRRRARAFRTAAPALVLAAVVLLTSGCDLRLETPPPPQLVPDAVETARQRTVADSVALGVLADHASVDSEEAVSALLVDVATAADLHVTALGGVYVPAPTDPEVAATPSPTLSPGPASAEGADPGDVLALLRETAASARADAAAVPDGQLARVLASVSAARTALADALARAGVPDVPGALPETPTAPPPDDEDPTGGSGLTGRAVPTVPETLPPGMGTGTTGLVVQSEDGLAVAWEVLGARVPELRDTAAARAADHRWRAQAWAVTSGLDTQGLDPRRTQYDLPEALTAGADAWDPAAARGAVADLETALAGLYGTLLVDVEAGQRGDLVDAMVDAVRLAAELRGELDGGVLALPALADPA